MSSLYASLAQLITYGAPSAAFGSLSDADRTAALVSASAELDAAISSQGTVPLVSPIPDDLVQRVCHIATYELMVRVGFNPGLGTDQNYFLRANGPNGARAYFRDIARGIVRPLVTFSSDRATRAQPKVRSKPLRGW